MSQHHQQHQAHLSDNQQHDGSEVTQAKTPSIDNQAELPHTQLAPDVTTLHDSAKAQTTASVSPNLGVQQQMVETIGNSPDLNKFQSIYDQNQAIPNSQHQQAVQKSNERANLQQSDALTTSKAQAFQTPTDQIHNTQLEDYDRAQPHVTGMHVQSKEVISNSVESQPQQQILINAPQQVAVQYTSQNENQYQQIVMKPNQDQSYQIGSNQVAERFNTPQKFAVSSQRSIGASMGETGLQQQNKIHEQDQFIEKQGNILNPNKEQQFSSEAKLQVNDLNQANNANIDIIYHQHSKIPQTDKAMTGQRMLTQYNMEDLNQVHTQNNIIFSEQVNKLSEFQEYDPSDSHSNLQINQQLAQINDLLEDNDDDVHVLNQQEPKMGLNQDVDDSASLMSSSQIPNSTKQPNGSNLIQANLVQPQRGQSSCENSLPQFHYKQKPIGSGSNSGAYTSEKVFFVENHNFQGSELESPQLAARNTTQSHSNLPQNQPGLGGSNIRHPSMDSRQPLQQLGQIDSRGTVTHGPHFNDQFNQYGFNNNPGAIVTSSRKSVYSNQELQKNNYFRDEHQREDQAQKSNMVGTSLYQQKLEIEGMQFSGQLSQQQIEDQIEATNAQQYEINHALSPQKIESPIIHSVGRSLNLSGLRSQDNFQGQRSENLIRERRLTGDEQNILGHHQNQFGKTFQHNLNHQFTQSAERRQDDFGIRLNSVSEDNNLQQNSQLLGTSQYRQLNMQGGLSQDKQQDNLQNNSQTYIETQQQFKGNNNFQQYRGTNFNQASLPGRQMIDQSIDQKNYPQSNRILVDDPQEQLEIENRMSEIQQMSEFNRNKLQGYRAGPNVANQSFTNYGNIQQQQAYSNINNDLGTTNDLGNINNSGEYHQQFMAQNAEMVQYRKGNEDRQEMNFNQNNMQHQNQMANIQQFYGHTQSMKMDQQQIGASQSFQGLGKMAPVVDMQHQMMVQSQYYASQSQNYHQMAMEEQQIIRQQQQQQSRIMLENEQQLQTQMSQLHLDQQSNTMNQQFQDPQARSQFQPSQQIQYHQNQLGQAYMPQQMIKGPKDRSNDRIQYNNFVQMQNAQQMQNSDILYQQRDMSGINGQNISDLPAFYPQASNMSYLAMQQINNRDTSLNINMQQQKMQQIHQQVSINEQQQRQMISQMNKINHGNNEDISNQDLQIANPNGFRALQQMAASGQNELILGNNSAGTRNFGQYSGQMSKGSDKGQGHIWKQQTFGKSNELSVDLSENLSPDKDNFEQNCEQVLSSSRSSHQGFQKNQSKTAPAAHEMSTSQKSSARKGQGNSGNNSIKAALQQQNQSNLKQVGSAQGDQHPLIVSREGSKGKLKGIASRGAASDDDQIHLSSNSHYDSQTSKEYAVLSNRQQKQNLKHSVKDVTATASSQKNQSDGNKRKSSMNKGSSGLGLSSTAIPNEVQKDISEDLKNKKQNISRQAPGKIKSQSNYYDAKSMNEKISFGKSYNDGSQYSSKNSVKSGGNETGGSANLNQNYDRLNQKGPNALSTNNSNYGRKQSYSQGGSQNRNARSNQRMQFNVQTGSGHTNSGQHGSNQSYDEFIAQIQHDIRMAKGDIQKEFNVLDGNIMKLASKKVGSMFLQDYLKNADQQLINKIIDQVDGKLADLMVGKYGNFFCSKLIEYLQPHQRIHFLKQISGKKFVEISCDEKGTWALQNILHAAMKEEEYRIIEETIMRDDNISRLSKDKQGHHMINLIITSYPEPIREQIFNYICNNFKELAQDQNGLCVMKKIIEYAKKDPVKQKRIVENIIIDSLEYVQHEFGNFVVQEIINLYNFETCKGIYKQMEGHFQRLSLNKFSSKLIETCIDRAPLELQDQIVKEFCSSPCLSKVVQGNFGNFVLQKSIEKYLKSKYNKLELIESIIKCLEEVSDYKVQEKWGDQLLVRYIHSLDTFPHFSEVDSSLNSEQDLKAFMEKKRNVEILLQQKMKVIQDQHQIQKQYIQNQMQGGKSGQYGGGYHGGRGGHGNSFTAKYNSQGIQSSGAAGVNYINNKHHQKMNKGRGGNKGGQGNQQPHRNSLNAINKDSQGYYDTFNQGNMMFQQSQGKFDPMFVDQNIGNQNQVPTNYVMNQQFGSNNYQMQQPAGSILPNQNDQFNYPRFDGVGQNFGQQQPVHPGDMQNQGVGVMGRPSTGNFNPGQFQSTGNNNMMFQQARGNDSRNQRGGFYPQNQQQSMRGQQSAQSFYHETQQPINQVQGRNSQPHPSQFQKKGKANQSGQNYKIQKNSAQGMQSHGGQQRRDYKKVFKRSNINFADGQGNNAQQQFRQQFQPTNNNMAGSSNMQQQNAQNSTPNLVQAAVVSDQQLQGSQIGHAQSQQQLEPNNAPSSLFNNDPLGITPNGSSGGTTGRENENELDQ